MEESLDTEFNETVTRMRIQVTQWSHSSLLTDNMIRNVVLPPVYLKETDEEKKRYIWHWGKISRYPFPFLTTSALKRLLWPLIGPFPWGLITLAKDVVKGDSLNGKWCKAGLSLLPLFCVWPCLFLWTWLISVLEYYSVIFPLLASRSLRQQFAYTIVPYFHIR